MDREFYVEKLIKNDHLESNTYQKIDQNSDKKVFTKLNHLINKHSECFTKNENTYLTQYQWKTSNFYIMPKINKCEEIITIIEETNDIYIKMDPPNILKGRPIIAGPNSPTQRLSSLLEKILTPIVPKLKTYIKDDWDFLRKLPQNLEPHFTLLTCDIISLYTNIPHDLGLRALNYYIDKYRYVIPSRFTKDFILEATEFVLKNNNFIFLEQMYNQVIGTAMGTKFGPPYANLSIGFLEETILFPIELPKYFSFEYCGNSKQMFKRYI